MIRTLLFKIFLVIVNKNFCYIFEYFFIPVITIRLRQLTAEVGEDNVLRRLGALNMYHRNGGKVIDDIIAEAMLHLRSDDLNIRWIISSLDSVCDCERISKPERGLALAYSLHLNSLKLLFAVKPDKTVRELKYGLSTFKSDGDLFFNQRLRLISLTRDCADGTLKEFFGLLDSRLCEVFASCGIPYAD